MTVWLIVGSVLGAAALAAVGYCGWKVFGEVKGLAKAVGAAGEEVAAAIEPVTEGLAAARTAREGVPPPRPRGAVAGPTSPRGR